MINEILLKNQAIKDLQYYNQELVHLCDIYFRSDLKKIKDVKNNQHIEITNIPLSDNANVIGRRIYRTKSNDTKLWLLVDIDDNTTTTYIDTINDDELAIEYEIYNNIK